VLPGEVKTPGLNVVTRAWANSKALATPAAISSSPTISAERPLSKPASEMLVMAYL
jgi:hypothetical protein